MTPEERIQLTQFLQLLTQARTGPKDQEAEALIRDAFNRQPDAQYLLVQRVIQLENAQRPAFAGDPNAWGRSPVTPSAPQPAPQNAYAGRQPTSTWGAGLLGTVASTAAGVVAGSFLAQGIGSLFGHHDAHAASASSDPIPPGGGTLVETDYGAGAGGDHETPPTDDYRSDNSIADDFDPGDTGDVG